VATPHRLRYHAGVFRSVRAYMHEAMVAAYVRDATFTPIDDETLARRAYSPRHIWFFTVGTYP
jgi:hypothetical protein